eukprot:scaffold8518_cov135-Isochrysis_galbana.AAC.8
MCVFKSAEGQAQVAARGTAIHIRSSTLLGHTRHSGASPGWAVTGDMTTEISVLPLGWVSLVTLGRAGSGSPQK